MFVILNFFNKRLGLSTNHQDRSIRHLNSVCPKYVNYFLVILLFSKKEYSNSDTSWVQDFCLYFCVYISLFTLAKRVLNELLEDFHLNFLYGMSFLSILNNEYERYDAYEINSDINKCGKKYIVRVNIHMRQHLSNKQARFF